jgi:hypothetical protein
MEVSEHVAPIDTQLATMLRALNVDLSQIMDPRETLEKLLSVDENEVLNNFRAKFQFNLLMLTSIAEWAEEESLMQNLLVKELKGVVDLIVELVELGEKEHAAWQVTLAMGVIKSAANTMREQFFKVEVKKQMEFERCHRNATVYPSTFGPGN